MPLLGTLAAAECPEVVVPVAVFGAAPVSVGVVVIAGQGMDGSGDVVGTGVAAGGAIIMVVVMVPCELTPPLSWVVLVCFDAVPLCESLLLRFAADDDEEEKEEWSL